MQKDAKDKFEITEETIPDIIARHLPDYKDKVTSLTRLQGLTNQTFRVSATDLQTLVFRKFCGVMDRNIQNKIFFKLCKRNIAPSCYYACEQYRIEKFVHTGRHPTNEELRDEKLVEKILKKDHEFHQVNLPEIKDQDQAKLVRTLLSQQVLDKVKTMKNENNTEKFEELRKSVLSLLQSPEKIRQKYVPKDKETLKFCHNDLNTLNIFVTEDSVILIDFQYASYNYIAYDIANFLNESTIDYTPKQFPQFCLLRKLTEEEIYRYVNLYPKKYKGIEVDVVKCLAICNLYWAVWSLDSANDSVSQEFGSCEHGLMRLELHHHYSKLLDQIQTKADAQEKK